MQISQGIILLWKRKKKYWNWKKTLVINQKPRSITVETNLKLLDKTSIDKLERYGEFPYPKYISFRTNRLILFGTWIKLNAMRSLGIEDVEMEWEVRLTDNKSV